MIACYCAIKINTMKIVIIIVIRRCHVHCRMQILLEDVPSKLLSGDKWWLPNKASVLWSRRSKVFSNHFTNSVWDRTPEWHHQRCFNKCYIFWIQSCCLQWKFLEDRWGETCRIEVSVVQIVMKSTHGNLQKNVLKMHAWFVYTLVDFLKSKGNLSSTNFASDKLVSQRYDVDGMCKKAWEEITATTNPWIHHKCDKIGCSEGEY